MNFENQANQYLAEIASTVRPNTLQVYRSILDSRILPAIGGLELADVGNKTVKALVVSLTDAHLSPATITLAVGLVKQIVKSAVDEEGNRLYRVDWNSDFIKAPKVNPKSQSSPIATSEALSKAVAGTKGEIRVLVALLAGTGLRVGEALAVGVGPDWAGNVWDPESGTIEVRATLTRHGLQIAPKTEAGNRIVDLSPELNSFLKAEFPQSTGQLFHTPLRTLYRRIHELNIDGFHSMRRFRITHQQMQNVPAMLVKYGAGHAASDISERYTKVGSQIAARKQWAQSAGLGFELHAKNF